MVRRQYVLKEVQYGTQSQIDIKIKILLMNLNNKLKCRNQLPVPANYVKHIRRLF